MNWDDLKIFLAVAEAPSMRHAAKSLQISHSTVSRRIEALESSLGARLFDRLPDGYTLTLAGQELLPVALKMDESVHTFGRRLAGRDAELKGEVVVTLPSADANCLFSSIILDFMRAYPDIHVTVIDSYEVFDLSKREADVAIRVTDSPPEHLIGRRIGTMHQAAYATAQYLKEHDPAHPESTAQWIGWGSTSAKTDWFKQLCPFPNLSIRGSFKSVELQMEAVSAGLGIGFLPCAFVPAQSNLLRISEPAPTMDFWMLSHPDLRSSGRVRAFRQFVGDRIPMLKAALTGEAQKIHRVVA